MIETDAAKLAERIKQDFPTVEPLTDPIWRQSAAAKVIDCVLSLRRRYKLIVVPRVQAFVAAHPEIQSCADLLMLIRDYETPAHFVAEALDMKSPGKASMLVGVLDYLIDVQTRFEEPTEDDRLTAWAHWTRPGDYLTLDVRNFKIAGFQYLRMLFGADTVKPDGHILEYVEEVLDRTIVGRPEREVRAVYALERAGELLGRPIRNVDVAIWERKAGHKLPS